MSNRSIYDNLLNLASQPERDYATHIGNTTIAWNSLHTLTFMWFYKLSGLSLEVAKNLWECGASDAQQRNMLQALADKIKNQRAKDDFLWTLKQSQDLSSYRNSLIHAPVMLHHESGQLQIAAFATKSGHVERFKVMRQRNCFRDLINDIEGLDSFFFKLFMIVTDKRDDDPWPERPLLKAFPEMNGDKKCPQK